MTKVKVFREGGNIRGFDIHGHAGAGNGGEYDMVCAAISGIAYTALGALDEMCGIHAYHEADGHLKMMLPPLTDDTVRNKANIILEAMEIGFKQIEAQYPRYIRTLCKEV
jgi:uncharacterized protein YsxB (DUF464 family)